MLKGILFCVISSGRPHNVAKIKNLYIEKTWPKVYWFVGKGEKLSYEREGAYNVYETASLPRARNMALKTAFSQNHACLQMSDDISYLRFLNVKKKVPGSISEASLIAKRAGFTEMTAEQVAQALFTCAQAHGTTLCGVYPSKNPGMAVKMPEISEQLFCIGDFFLTLPSSPRFDNRLTLKEDYDFTCKHIMCNGKISRMNRIIVGAQHYTNKGGAVDRRKASLEEKSIDILLKKWPRLIRRHPRRPHEVLLLSRKPKVDEPKKERAAG